MPKHVKKTNRRKKGLSKAKAKKILRHGEVRGKKLTPKQRRFMGARSR